MDRMNDPLKQYRHQFRAWRNERRLARELRYYSRQFDQRACLIPDETTIRTHMTETCPEVQAKPKGTLRILALYHHYNWENYSLKPALEKFGHLRHYDWGDEFDHQKPDWHRHVKARMNKTLAEKVKKWVAIDGTDVIFTYLSGALVTPDTMKELHSLHIPMMNLCLNDKEYFVGKLRRGQAMGMRDICRYFDLCWTSTEDALEKYCVEGGVPLYLPEGANPDVHRPYGEEKTIDVSFVGQCYGKRPHIIQKLRERGIGVEAFGAGWPRGALSHEEMVRLYSRSVINLGFGSVDGHRDTFCLKGRDFEIPMSGGFYLTEYHDELKRAYEPGKEIATYDDFDDLVEKIEYFLANPDRREEIRRRGFERARRDHSWEKRFDKVFTLLGVI